MVEFNEKDVCFCAAAIRGDPHRVGCAHRSADCHSKKARVAFSSCNKKHMKYIKYIYFILIGAVIIAGVVALVTGK